MAKLKVSLVKKSAAPRMASRGAKAADQAAILQDNQDQTVTVFGVDAGGAQVDISSVATLAVTSSDPAILTVDAPNGATFAHHGVAPGEAKVEIVATWSDGSVGPFTIDLPVTVTGSPVSGLQVLLGTPTSR